MPAGAPPEAERLYGLPLDEFVSERNALARELRTEGRREEADLVRELRRPALAVWAINQLARRQADQVARLLEAGDRLRSGKLEAAEEVSSTIDQLVRSARGLLAGSGHAASDATVQRVAATLRAAVADDEHA